MKKYLVENSGQVAYVQFIQASVIHKNYELLLFEIFKCKKLMHYWQ